MHNNFWVNQSGFQIQGEAEKLLENQDCKINELLEKSDILELRKQEKFIYYLIENPNNLKKLIYFALYKANQIQKLPKKISTAKTQNYIKQSFLSKELLTFKENNKYNLIYQYIIQSQTEQIIAFRDQILQKKQDQHQKEQKLQNQTPKSNFNRFNTQAGFGQTVNLQREFSIEEKQEQEQKQKKKKTEESSDSSIYDSEDDYDPIIQVESEEEVELNESQEILDQNQNQIQNENENLNQNENVIQEKDEIDYNRQIQNGEKNELENSFTEEQLKQLQKKQQIQIQNQISDQKKSSIILNSPKNNIQLDKKISRKSLQEQLQKQMNDMNNSINQSLDEGHNSMVTLNTLISSNQMKTSKNLIKNKLKFGEMKKDQQQQLETEMIKNGAHIFKYLIEFLYNKNPTQQSSSFFDTQISYYFQILSSFISFDKDFYEKILLVQNLQQFLKFYQFLNFQDTAQFFTQILLPQRIIQENAKLDMSSTQQQYNKLVKITNDLLYDNIQEILNIYGYEIPKKQNKVRYLQIKDLQKFILLKIFHNYIGISQFICSQFQNTKNTQKLSITYNYEHLYQEIKYEILDIDQDNNLFNQYSQCDEEIVNSFENSNQFTNPDILSQNQENKFPQINKNNRYSQQIPQFYRQELQTQKTEETLAKKNKYKPNDQSNENLDQQEYQSDFEQQQQKQQILCQSQNNLALSLPTQKNNKQQNNLMTLQTPLHEQIDKNEFLLNDNQFQYLNEILENTLLIFQNLLDKQNHDNYLIYENREEIELLLNNYRQILTNKSILNSITQLLKYILNTNSSQQNQYQISRVQIYLYQLIQLILKSYAFNKNADEKQQQQDFQQFLEILKILQQILEKNISLKKKKLDTQFGDRIKPLGQENLIILQIFKLFFYLGYKQQNKQKSDSIMNQSNGKPQISDKIKLIINEVQINLLQNTNFIPLLYKIVFKFEWNNIMHQIIYKILKFTIQNTNLEIVKSLLSEKNDIIKMIINNYRKDNLFTSIGRSNHCTRGYVSLIEKLSVLIYKQSFLLQLINHSSKDIDQDELIFYKSAKLPLVELDNPPEFQRQKLWIIDKREVKEQEDEQPKILYKLGHFNCWVEILDPESFHSIKEGKINPNFQFWDHYLNKNLEWQDYKQYKLELIIEEGNANLNKIKNIITTNQEELKLFQIDLSIKKQRNSQTYANSPNIQVLSGNLSSNISLPQEQNNNSIINNNQSLNNNKNYINDAQAIKNTIQLKPIQFQSQVQIDKLSKQERIGRSKSIRIQKKFLSEPPTIDVFDKREIFLNMVVNGCFRLICFNKYCANNKNNKKNISQLQAALLLRKLPQNELDNLYDCDTYEKIHQNKMDKDPDQQLNQKKQRLQKELRDLQKEYQKIDFLPNFMDQFQKIEEITKKVEQILKQCQNQPEFFEITVDIKKLQNKVSDTFQALPKKKIYLINQQKQNQANRERDINLCIHMGKIYEQNMNDIEKASQYYKQAQKEAIQANSIVHILKSRFLINNIREQHVINQLQQNSNLRIRKLKEQSQSQHVSFASDSYSQSNQSFDVQKTQSDINKNTNIFQNNNQNMQVNYKQIRQTNSSFETYNEQNQNFILPQINPKQRSIFQNNQ